MPQPPEIAGDFVARLLQQWAAEQPDLDVSALGVVVRLQHVARHLARRANRALKRHGLKHWEYDVLSILRRQGDPFELAATDLAHAAQLTSGAMTTRIDGLEKRGLVVRRQSTSDGRSVLVGLTPAGAELIDRAMATRLEDARSALAALTADERGHLAGYLGRLLADRD